MGRSCSQEEGRSALKTLAVKLTGNKPLESSRRRWEDNIRIDLKEIRGIGLIRLRIEIIGKPFLMRY